MWGKCMDLREYTKYQKFSDFLLSGYEQWEVTSSITEQLWPKSQ